MSKGETGTKPEYLTIQTALQQGTALLESAGVSVPRLTAEVLLAHAMRCSRTFLYSHSSDELTQLAWIHYGRYLNDRMRGKPTQYITHHQEFFGRDFFVNEDVLIPRPETEHLVEVAIEYAKAANPKRILDVGTGSGAIAISFATECDRSALACDISLAALRVAERNRQTHAARVHFFHGDLLSAAAPDSIDLLLSNPPYVPGADAANMQAEVRNWEPHIALFASDDGMEIYRTLIRQSESVVTAGGRIVMELGYRSLDGVTQMLQSRWTAIQVTSDLAGLPRVIAATKLA